MKLPKIDLSKEGMKRFTLHHIEKVILLLALAGFAVFCWLGFKTESFGDTDPEKLSQKADSARTYMMNDASWTSVDSLRITRDNADNIVQTTEELKLEGYDFSKSLLGTPRQSLGLRHDPDIELIKPSDVEVDVVTAPVFFRRGDDGKIGRSVHDRMDELASALERDSEESDSRKKDEGPMVGEQVSGLNQLVGVGFRSGRAGTNSANDVSLIKTVVAVKALIKHKEFWTNVESKLKNTFGYFPERDRPNYKILQIQRKEGNGKWQDRTIYQQRIEAAYPGRAPEVVDPSSYDPALTGRIPTMPLVDYRTFANHSKAPLRNFDKFLTLKAQDESEVVSTENPDSKDESGFDDPFGGGNRPSDADERENDAHGEMKPIRSGSDRTDYKDLDQDGPSGEYKVVRFFDVWDVRPGKQYTYRFRIWTDDPNHEGEKKSSGASDNKKGGNSRNDRDNPEIGALGGTGGGGGSASLTDDGAGPPGGARGGNRGPGGGNRGPGGGNSGGNQPIVYKKVHIPDASKHIFVRNRIDDHLAMLEKNVDGLNKFATEVRKQFGVDLEYCRATEWVEVTVNVPDTGTADALVGNVVARQTKSPRREPVTVTDQIAQVLVSEWSSAFGTLVSKFRQVRKGDWLNFEINSPTNVLDVVDNQMKKLEDFRFQTDQMVVDLMGGEKIDLRTSPVDYRTPGEMLLMDDEGNVFIRNSFEQKRDYLLRSQAFDESSEYNLKKRRSSRAGKDDDR